MFEARSCLQAMSEALDRPGKAQATSASLLRLALSRLNVAHGDGQTEGKVS